MILLVLINVGLVDTGNRFPVEVRIFRLHHGLLQEAIVLGLKRHDLSLLAGHSVNAIDQICKVLFFPSRPILHMCLRLISTHLLQLESSLITSAGIEHLPLILLVNVLMTLIVLSCRLVVRQTIVAVALGTSIVLLVLRLRLLIVVDSFSLMLILLLRVRHTLAVLLLCVHI